MIPVVIIAGGRGTRLAGISNGLPKSLMPIGGRPLIEHQLAALRREGVREITMLVGYGASLIKDHCGSGERYGVSIKYVQEPSPLGTAGALAQLRGRFNRDFLVVYGDLLFDLNLAPIQAYHHARGALATLVAHPNDHSAASDLLQTDAAGRVTAWFPKHQRGREFHHNLVNAGVYVCSPAFLDYLATSTQHLSDLGREVFPTLLTRGAPLYAYRTSEYINDMGTSEEQYRRVERQHAQGLPGALSSRHPRRPVFLDRDGTINLKTGFVSSPDQFTLATGAAQGIRKLNDAGFLAICVTNQSVIARNLCDEATLDVIHKKMETLLGAQGAHLDALYYCPHHPDRGFPGERAEYKVPCECRKPNIGMFKAACEEFNIDFAQSYTVGDAPSDIEAGVRAGTKTLYIGDWHGDANGVKLPDGICGSLGEAAEWILAHDH